MNSKLAYFFCLFCLTFSLAFSQNVGIGTTTPDASSILELNSTTLGFLVPRMTDAQKTAISSPATGLLIYQTDLPNGFWYYDGTMWKQLTSVEKIDDLIDGKSDSDGSNDYSSVFLGLESGRTDIENDSRCIGLGYQSLYSNNDGYANIAIGYQALYLNTNTSGSQGLNNNAIGYQALYSNTSASGNNAFGLWALYSNTIGQQNTAIGHLSMYFNTEGHNNVALGAGTNFLNTTGDRNTASGYGAIASNFTGNENTASGYNSLYSITSGSDNTALGAFAYNTGNFSNSTALGANTAITASNQVRVGDASVTSIGGQVGWTTLSDANFKKNVQNNVPGLIFINQLKPVTYNLDVEKINEFLGVTDKKNNMDKLMEKAFEGKSEDEIKKISKLSSSHGNNTKTDEFMLQSIKEKSEMVQSGFLAQDVEKAANALGYDFSGVDKPKNDKDHYGLRYAEFVVPLVKAVQELSQKNEQLNSKHTQLESEIEVLKKENNEIKEKLDWIVSKLKN